MYLFNTPKGPKFIMLVGLPCSGKSTWLKEFILSDGGVWTVLSTDAIYEEYAAEKGISYSQAYLDLPGKKVQTKFRLSINESFKARKNIIWDQTNVYPNARRKKLASLPKKDYEAIAVVFELGREELNRRNAARLAEEGKFISDKTIDIMAENYVRPSKAEGFTHVHVFTE